MRIGTRFGGLVLLALVLVGPARAQINLNLQEAEILTLVRLLSEATGKTFIPDETVAQVKVTIVSSRDVGTAEAYRIFESVLRLNGFSTVEEGNVIKIVPTREVKTEGGPVLVGDRGIRPGDSFLTHVFFLRYANAENLVTLLRPMVSPNGHLVADPSSNAMIVADPANNVRRFRSLVDALDVEGARRQIRAFPLLHASAETLANILTAVLEKGNPSGRTAATAATGIQSRGQEDALAIVPDPRTNTLLVTGTNETLQLVSELIERLDIPEAVERSSLHVYRLRHANAEKLAEILTAQVRESSRSTGQQAAASTSNPGKTTQVEGQFESKVTVTADPATNSLVVAATPEDYRVVHSVIEQLDAPRAQVFVQALVLEASSTATQKLGVELRFTDALGEDGLNPIGGTTFPVGGDPSVTGQVTTNPLSPPSGLIIGAVDGTIEFNGVEFLNLAGLARALQSDNGFNVLSMPHTTTLDNQESKIVVGEERPFLSSQQATDVGTIVSNFDFKDIGITLTFTPHISVDGQVRLDMSVEITNFVSEAQGTVGAVTTTKRSVETSVLVESEQMAVIGGLMQEQVDRASARVPCLGSIPVAGWLFKSSSKEKRKTNLLIFIEPRILPDRQSMEELRQEKQREFDDTQPRPKTTGEDLKDLWEQLESRPPR